MLTIAGAMAPVPAPITARRSQEKDFHTFGRVLRQCASHAEGLIIGVCEYSHQLQSVHETHLHMNVRRHAEWPRAGSFRSVRLRCRLVHLVITVSRYSAGT